MTGLVLASVLCATPSCFAPDSGGGCGSARTEVPRVLDALAPPVKDVMVFRPLSSGEAGDARAELVEMGPCVIPFLADDCAKSERRWRDAMWPPSGYERTGAASREVTRQAEIATILADLGEPAVEPVVKLLASKRTCRSTWLRTLEMMATRGQVDARALGTALPHVAAGLSDKDPFVRLMALWAIDVLPVEGSEVAIPGLVRTLLDDRSSDTKDRRERAAHALGRMGARATAAVPALRHAVLDPDASVRAAVHEALHSITEPK